MSYKKADRLVLERYEYGDPEGALELALEELAKVAQRRRDAEWHFLCGYRHFELDDADEAEPYFREALKLRPDHERAGHYLGCVLFDQGEYAQALPVLQSSSERVSQAWDNEGRFLKAKELLLCCQLYTQSRLPALRALDDLVDLFSSNLMIAPAPLEIVPAPSKIPAKVASTGHRHRYSLPGNQSRQVSPGTRANSDKLWEITVNFREVAMDAISRSRSPIGLCRNSPRMRACSWALAGSKSSMP